MSDLIVSGALMPAMSIEQAVQRYRQQQYFVEQVMEDGKDFMVLPSTEKPTLLLPGAQKLVTFFGLTSLLEPLEVVQDWTGENHGGEPFFHYTYRAVIKHGATILAVGDGSCNSWEGRYRWRWVPGEYVPSHVDPSTLMQRSTTRTEYAFAIDKAETGGKYGKPAEYWETWREAIKSGEARQVMRRSASGKEMDAWEMGDTAYRVPNDDVFTLVNTILKIAQKRAFVGAVITATNASAYFTQDLEDMDGTLETHGKAAAGNTAAAQKPEPPKQEAPKPVHWVADPDKVTRFWAWVEKRGLTTLEAYDALDVGNLSEYKGSAKDAADAVTEYINGQAVASADADKIDEAEPQEA